MVKVPVLLGFDHTTPIGTLEVDETQLPPSADYHFAIGYRPNSSGGVELLSVSPALDAKFAYSDGRGAVPAPAPVTLPAPSREEVWLRIYAALAGALGANGPMARVWADLALEAFDAKFPPK